MLKIGHRGAKAYAPENTIISFQKALEMGVDMIELDIRITKDKYPVVIHDNQLTRLTRKFRRVSGLTLVEIQKFRIKKTEKIPTLAKVLEMMRDSGSKVGLNIDLKAKGSAQIVVQTLRDYKVDFSNIMISSNHPGELRVVEQLEPNITTALIFRSGNAINIWLVMDFLAILFLPITKYYIVWVVHHAHADYLNINYRLLDRKKVDLLRKKGIKICAWTANSRRSINYLKKLGVDGIITNYPDRL